VVYYNHPFLAEQFYTQRTNSLQLPVTFHTGIDLAIMDSDDDDVVPMRRAAEGTSKTRAAAKTNIALSRAGAKKRAAAKPASAKTNMKNNHSKSKATVGKKKDNTVNANNRVKKDTKLNAINTGKIDNKAKVRNMGKTDNKKMGKRTNTAAAVKVDNNSNIDKTTASTKRKYDKNVEHGNNTSSKSSTPNNDLDFARKVAKRARRAKSPEPQPVPAPGSSITVGSDCTGYGSDFIAFTLLGLDATLAFVAEMDAGKRELMRAAHKDMDFSKVIVYHDITKRDNTQAPYVDVFITGAPCQAWSQAGLKLGLQDEQHRGVVIFHSIEYVRCKRPRVVLIENVKGLTFADNKKVLDDILGALKDLGYTVEWRVLNTKDHGIPHSRPRLYIVAIRTRFLARSIEFPKKLHRTANLSCFIDVDDSRPASERPTTKCYTEAMSKAETKHSKKVLSDELVVIDTASSVKYSTSMVGCVPCITKSRGRQLLCFLRFYLFLFAHYAIIYPCNLVDRSGGHWISKLNRHTSLFELAGLQGLPRCILDRMLETSQTQGDVGAAIGDAMSINVLMRLLPLALDSAGLLDKPCRDVWKDSATVLGMMPDSLYVRKGCLIRLKA
jgi:DNA-cytosine methyltransferase